MGNKKQNKLENCDEKYEYDHRNYLNDENDSENNDLNY